ncbi:tRNA (N6-isopentenyl adenosine(37)-C2)-methylthiotransferase MiaB [Eubacterium oxidoreducens]|uniref:tRNA-2-methylthio-N(6)-dimethylallyladenosine synthase n=1 Tax=Eubacterium oxidoreducens TaxID=1732 RepID=A0A1G6AMY7_EUBOX|nr:tRNA (N6-isopentenyl adenosine(37)-C2)-methylthiotransferase MiaB [Eubacterium oxidoreducens]SDB09721.1 tRNA-2-methylthio-N6-dimethylallyladenosine synthase [Eubacterium oxidoreducens]
MTDTINIPTTEPQRQFYFIKEAKKYVDFLSKEKGRALTYFVNTFGCQMNARDSEKIVGILEQIGYKPGDSEESDLVIYNTCTVRENANNKIYGHLGYLSSYKEHNPDMKIALCGCMMQEQSAVDKIKSAHRFVDIIFGTHNIFMIAELIVRSFEEEKMVVEVWDGTDQIVENLPAVRKYPFKSGVNIMYGCNNFCSYCIVPYVRGRERSRKPEDIINEIKQLVADGVVEVMLLGQNVNSYGKNLEHPITFAQLLEQVEQIEGLERIRFMTSHPKDLSDELIMFMKHSKKVCHHFHLPLQSGSTKLLEDMNRHYTKEDYLLLVEKLRKAVPDIAITTDIIVGYPGETEEDFLETMDVVERVKYDSAFTFIYSKRSGTPAAKRDDQITPEVIKNRFDRLLKRVQQLASEKAKALEGKTMDVLVESVNSQNKELVSGRLSNNSIVHFAGNKELIGQIVSVKLVCCKGFYYIGERI